MKMDEYFLSHHKVVQCKKITVLGVQENDLSSTIQSTNFLWLMVVYALQVVFQLRFKICLFGPLMFTLVNY